MTTNLGHKPFIKRHPKKTIAMLGVVLVFVYLTVCAFTVLKVRSVRKRPKRAAVVALFSGNLPHNFIGRLVLFRPGTPEYNLDVLSWANNSRALTDNYWNRWILERAILEIPEDERLDLLPQYPLKPTERLLPDLRKALQNGQYRVLPLLNNMEGDLGRQISRTWIEESIVKPRNTQLFVNASGFLARSSSPNYFTETVGKFWPQLTKAQKQRVITKLAGHLSGNEEGLTDVFKWTTGTLANGSIDMSCATITLLGRFLSTPALKAQALGIVSDRAGEIDASYVPLLFHFSKRAEFAEFAKPIAEKVKDKNATLLLEIIHQVADMDIMGAEEISKPFLSTPDSMLRKGLIVLLVRHGSVVGKRMINDTFSGQSPRKTMYFSSSDYEKGNSASEKYRALSTHDYKETGKTWPPSYLRGLPSRSEISGWQQFIQLYPWFPGTDDAYYRLAFSQLAQADQRACWATVKQYLNRDYWPDNDASAYMYHILRTLVLSSNVADTELPFVQHFRNILSKPIAVLAIDGDVEGLDSVIASIDWFLANPKYIKFLNTDRHMLNRMAEIARLIRDTPLDSVWRMVASKIDQERLPSDTSEFEIEGEIAQEEGDLDGEADDIAHMCYDLSPSSTEEPEVYMSEESLSVLYAVFRNFPQPPARAAKISVPADTGEDAIRRMAAYLNSNFSGLSLDAVNDGGREELLTLALLHTGRDFKKWEDEFKPTLNFLSALNTRHVPHAMAQKHVDFLQKRMR
jgi:hypothetical protein